MKRMIPLLLCLLMLGLWGCEIRQADQPGPLLELEDVSAALEGAVVLSVHTKKGEVFGPYQVEQLQLPDKPMGRLVENPSGLGRYTHWLVIEAGDAAITVYIGERNLICLEENDQQVFYQEEDGALALSLRHSFDEAEFEAQVFRVMPVVAGASGALREYAGNAYPSIGTALAPGGIYRFRDYDLMDYQVESSGGSTMTGTFVYTVLPDSEDSVLYDRGELLEEAPYEGYVLITERVMLEHREDGYWYAAPVADEN